MSGWKHKVSSIQILAPIYLPASCGIAWILCHGRLTLMWEFSSVLPSMTSHNSCKWACPPGRLWVEWSSYLSVLAKAFHSYWFFGGSNLRFISMHTWGNGIRRCLPGVSVYSAPMWEGHELRKKGRALNFEEWRIMEQGLHGSKVEVRCDQSESEISFRHMKVPRFTQKRRWKHHTAGDVEPKIIPLCRCAGINLRWSSDWQSHPTTPANACMTKLFK